MSKRRRLTLAGIVSSGVVAVAVVTGVASARSNAAPQNVSAPTIEGTFEQGNTVSASNGIWQNSPTKFTRQWQRCDANGANCVDVAGQTRRTYNVTSRDVDNTLRVIVTASNADGQTAANSKPSPLVSSNGAPRNTTRPSITGTPKVGEQLNADPGKWSGGASTFSYQWQRCDASGNNCGTIPGSTGQAYGVRTADAGFTLRVVVTAKNAAGSASDTSDRTNTVQPASSGGGSGGGGGGGNASCSPGGSVNANTLVLPTRMIVDRWTFTPNVVTMSTGQVVGRIHVADTCGRSVVGAAVWATAVPYNQTNVAEGSTAADGWTTLTFNMQGGFPANPGRQQILAMLVRASKPGGSTLAGVSTVRVLRVNVNLHG
jgi:hypothetical protein